MSNEIITSQGKTIDFATLKEEMDNAHIEMHISVENRTTKDGKDFKKVRAYMYLECFEYDKDGNEKSIGRQNRWLEVHFKKVAFKLDKNPSSNVSDIEDLQNGILFVKAKYVEKPNRYIVKNKLDKNKKVVLNEKGEPVKKYPCIWINGGVIGLLPLQATQEMFNRPNSIDVDSSNVKVDDSTGEVLEG